MAGLPPALFTRISSVSKQSDPRLALVEHQFRQAQDQCIHSSVFPSGHVTVGFSAAFAMLLALPVWRQLLLRIDDNYFSGSTTISSGSRRREAAAAVGEARPAFRLFVLRE